MKSRIKNHLSITKKEWDGIIVLLIIIALVLVAPYVYQHMRKDTIINFKDFDKAVALLNQSQGDSLSNGKIVKPVLFAFNPNNLPHKQWKKLGLSERQIGIIKNFEAKGGHFYKKEDVRKIYGITTADYKRLAPYINITGAQYAANKAKPGEVIEINSADSAKLTRIHGIGPAFAARIIAYRNRLGGFLNKEQLKEVYGMDDVRYDGIKTEVSINPAYIAKIKINEVDFEGLRKFPYLTNKQTNAVIQYRSQHGHYQTMNDMRDIAILDERILRKIAPYIDFK